MEMLLTVEQAAQRLQLAPFTVREQLKRGQLRGMKRGKVWRIPESALLETTAQEAPHNSGAKALTPLARALALVEARDASNGPVSMRTQGQDDAATQLRELREERTLEGDPSV